MYNTYTGHDAWASLAPRLPALQPRQASLTSQQAQHQISQLWSGKQRALTLDEDIPMLHTSVSPPPKIHSSVSPSSNEAQAPQRHTISEDRSAGSNLEVRNLAALKDWAASQKPSEPEVENSSQGEKRYTSAPFAHEFSMGHAQLQQRFGQLRFDEENPNEHMDDADQRILEDDLFTADISVNPDHMRPRLIAKHDWVENIEQIDAGSGLQADIEILYRNLASMQKELGELEMQKRMHTNKQFQILYRIQGTCYHDHPEWTQGYKSIVSRIPVKNLDLFLERNKYVVFIVYRDFDPVPPRTGARNKISTPKHIRESIHPVSRKLAKHFR
jgi:hypothetical protein